MALATVIELVIEPHGDLVDDLADSMAIDEEQKVSATIGYIENAYAYAYAWALALDYADKSQCARFWYVSEIKSARREATQRLQAIRQGN